VTGAASTSELREMRSKSDSSGFRLLGHHALGGYGDGFQVLKRGDWLYVAHLGRGAMGLSILDCSDPSAPRLVRQIEHAPSTRSHKIQIVGDLMIQNAERPYWLRGTSDVPARSGLMVHDLTDPTDPKPISFHEAAEKGTHRLWFEEMPYAHIATYLPGGRFRSYEILDLSDPVRPRAAGSWSIPGSFPGDSDPWPMLREGEHFGVHSAIPVGDRAYLACMDAGMAILDIADPTEPKLLGRLDWSPPFGGYVHTTLPLPERGLVIASDEALEENVHGGEKRIWVVDVREPRQPVTVATFPEPKPPSRSGVTSYRDMPGERYGPHNLHENRRGSYVSDIKIFATYFNAGLRVYDISDKYRPEEVAHYVPPTPEGQEGPLLNDLYVDEGGIVYVTDRENGGLYILQFEDA
jgi:hypothetical protein